MQRTLLIVLATALVAAGIATGATLLLTGGDDEPDVALASPSGSPVVTFEPSPSPSPGTSASPEASDDEGTPAPSVVVIDDSSGPVTPRSAKSVDCDEESEFCSSADSAVIEDGKLESAPVLSSDPNSNSHPTIAMTSEVRKDGKNKASVGGVVKFIHVEVVVTNKTDETFKFAKREVVLELYRNGKLLDEYATSGDGFDMTPGSKMNASFDRPVQDDGTYRWRTKVWYYSET